MNINSIEITHADKMLFPDDNITKNDVAEYYNQIAVHILPFIKDRPLTLKRYPDGINKAGFFNKHIPDYFPDLIQRLVVPTEQDESQMKMVGVDNARGLIYLAEQNTIELHITSAKITDIKKPDQIIFDFDPSDNDFEKVRSAALTLNDLLDSLNLPSFVKTSGSRGVHVHVPIKVCCSFKEVKYFAKKIAEQLNKKCPGLTTLEQRKKKRGDKVFIDYLRNDYAMTVVAPYSLRALQGAPIATPVFWDELKDKSLDPRTYSLKNIFHRLAQKNDPWENFVTSSIDIQSGNIALT